MTGKIVSYAVLVAIIVAVWYARRKGRQSFQGAIAAAEAKGEASVRAQLTAAATSGVDVGGVHLHVDNRRQSMGDSATDRPGDYNDHDRAIVAAVIGELRRDGLLRDTGRELADPNRPSLPEPTRHRGHPLYDDVGALVAGGDRNGLTVLPRAERG